MCLLLAMKNYSSLEPDLIKIDPILTNGKFNLLTFDERKIAKEELPRQRGMNKQGQFCFALQMHGFEH